MIPVYQDSIASIVTAGEIGILVLMLLPTTCYALLFISALIDFRLYLPKASGDLRRRLLRSALVPRISVLAPAYNEEKTIADSVRGLLGLHYSSLEVIVINDGSRDKTLEVLQREFELLALPAICHRQLDTKPVRALYRSLRYPHLIVIDKDNGGKADALNVGLNFATEGLVCALDADTLLEADALQRAVMPFLESSTVIAVGASIQPANGSTISGGRVIQARVPRTWLAGIQTVEYLRAFLFGRLGWNRLGGNLIIAGAFGLFSSEALIRSGGYRQDTVGEDMELTVRLRRLGYEHGTAAEVVYIPDILAWTEVPDTWTVLGRQRERWHRGLTDVLWRHKGMLFNPAYGASGMVQLPYFLLVELAAPVLEALGILFAAFLLAVDHRAGQSVLLMFLIVYLYGAVLSVFTLVISAWTTPQFRTLTDIAWLAGWAVVENLGYHQMTVLWRLMGLITYWRGKTEWGAMQRSGFRKAKVVRAS